MLSGHDRGLSVQMKRKVKRRSGTGAIVGHMKTDNRLDRNVLKGQARDVMDDLPAAASHSMWLIIAVFRAETLKKYRESG